ncbi:MAG: DUF998 domain-containing protein [Gammaproteobacteria bacterium]
MKRKLFASSVVLAVLYFSEVLILGALQPGYSHMHQAASELGMASAAHPQLFAIWVLAQAAVFLAAGPLFYQSVARATGRRKLAVAIGLFVAFFGVNCIFIAAFPLPDIRHSGYGIALFTFFVPWLIASAFWNVSSARGACYVQLVATPVLIFLALLQPGVAGFVDATNLGLFQRIGAGSFYGWLILSSLWLDRVRADAPVVVRSNV